MKTYQEEIWAGKDGAWQSCCAPRQYQAEAPEEIIEFKILDLEAHERDPHDILHIIREVSVTMPVP